MKRVIFLLGVVGLFTTPLLGCAKTGNQLPLPAHPFPRWVESLEVGQT